MSGWSCGGLQALDTAQAPRVTTSVIMNSGYFPEGTSPLSGVVSNKALLKTLHGSILYILGGPTDIAYPKGTDDYRRLKNIPAAMVNIPVGHGGTYMQPHGGVGAEVVTTSLDWKLKGAKRAKAYFTGPACGLCNDPRLTLERKSL